jgi:hypothetical protein
MQIVSLVDYASLKMLMFQFKLIANSFKYVYICLKQFLEMWTDNWEFVPIVRYADECCTGRKFNSLNCVLFY